MALNINEYTECPVDFIPLNENKVRIIAGQVFILIVAYVVTGFWPLIAFLIIDFFLRAFELSRFSLLAQFASLSVKLFSIKNKLIDQAPKLFAARIGIILSLSILVVHTEFPVIALSLGILFSLFAFLESVIGFCAGCYVYAIGKKLFPSLDR